MIHRTPRGRAVYHAGMPVTLVDRLSLLTQAFNEASLDVPDGLFDRACVFRLNGVAYEDTMGRPLTDPIVRMVARGPAAYRFLAQAVRYALPDARVRIDHVTPADAGPAGLASGTAALEGTLRGGDAFHARAAVAMVLGPAGQVQEFAVLVDDEHVAAIQQARRREP